MLQAKITLKIGITFILFCILMLALPFAFATQPGAGGELRKPGFRYYLRFTEANRPFSGPDPEKGRL